MTWWMVCIIWFLVLLAGYAYTYRVPRRLHRPQPDYAKIARLEVELGLVPPPAPPESVPVVRVSDVASGPFIRKVQAGRYPSPQTLEVLSRGSKKAPNGHRCWSAGQGECYSDCGIMPWGMCPYRPGK